MGVYLPIYNGEDELATDRLSGETADSRYLIHTSAFSDVIGITDGNVVSW